ncbi:unnamed protein product [Brassicogethes aeneus]|uniref:Acyltransferase 3 domain-containing protein n=1 Tax=Brassicogethes aeneus TaxID=1431903 RepID=A0A9P0AT86_BRAAE|nr:unnamed protein product [Brassicogethes aeneus]
MAGYNLILGIVFYLVTYVEVNSQSVLRDDFEKILPKIYNLENIEECNSIGDNFCEIRYSLKSKHENNTVWKYISEFKNHKHKFRKDRLYRGVCIPRDRDDLQAYLREKINKEELEKISLEPEVVDVLSCGNKYELLPNDYRLIAGFIGYVAFIMYATLYDLKLRTEESKGNNLLRAFSVIENNQKIRKPIHNEFYNKLKVVQGIRTYNMMLVVVGHSIMNFLIAYTSNTHFLEHMVEHAGIFFSLGMYLVQPFFFFTGMILMMSVHYVVEKEKKLSVASIVKLISLRVMRLWPTLIFIIAIHKSRLPNHVFQGAHTFLLQTDHRACNQYWWATLLFWTNNMDKRNVCNFATWYLSADMQNYVISIVALYVIYKWKMPLIRSILAILTTSLLLQMGVMYYYNVDVIYRVLPENFVIYNVLEEFWPIFIWYTSALSNNPSFTIGILFGAIFLKYDEHKFFSYQSVKVVWFLSFFGLPLLTCLLSTFTYNRLISAVLGASLKPMYTLGIGIGILGMSQGIGGFIKKICEWRPAEILAQTTYSVYLCHLAIVFRIAFLSTTLINVTVYNIVGSALANVIICFTVGFSLAHLVELPWSNIEKMIIQRYNRKKIE